MKVKAKPTSMQYDRKNYISDKLDQPQSANLVIGQKVWYIVYRPKITQLHRKGEEEKDAQICSTYTGRDETIDSYIY